MENPIKIKKRIEELNKQEPKSVSPLGSTNLSVTTMAWQEIPGYFAITKFEYGSNGKGPSFSPAFGIPIKAFFNTRTGEVRTFLASIFED
jgi:hypothetical protein